MGTVKRIPGFFRAVGADMCLEQTINRLQKSDAGIIGNSRKKQFVALWEIIYHEMLAVRNLHRELSGVKSRNSEFYVNHEFNISETKATEQKMSSMIRYIKTMENPMDVGPETDHKHHNILAQKTMTKDITDHPLNCRQIGKELYDQFRHTIFVEKSLRLLDTIHRTNLKNF